MYNVTRRLVQTCQQRGEQTAVAVPLPERDEGGKRIYRSVTFRELDQDSNRIASGLLKLGLAPGTRLVLLVPMGIDFITLVFALLKARLVAVLIDPGIGRRNLLKCLSAVNPEGFIAVPKAHAVRCLTRFLFPRSRFHVTVGRRWFWGGWTLDQVRQAGHAQFQIPATAAHDPAAIIFTTGSTGPPKGVLYEHGNFAEQARQIQAFYGIQPGEIDLPGFPLFALFNAAMGVTTVIPDMDFTRPASADPRRIIEAARDWQVTQAFGSPALWNVVGQHCERHQLRLESVRRVLSAGAPVPPHVLKRIKNAIHVDGDVHTPYGATEALPVASIAATQVLSETVHRWREGGGTCVGQRFDGIQWKVIQISDLPLADIQQVVELAQGQIGELIVRGPVVTRQYVTGGSANALHKISDGDAFWHRMGDVGYLDEQQRFWFCGRKSHRVQTSQGTLFTVPCEAIFNQHPDIYRSALVGVGPAGAQIPVIVVETWPDHRPGNRGQRDALLQQILERAAAHQGTRSIRHALWHPRLPVDIRHNAKIFREKLAVWAASRIAKS